MGYNVVSVKEEMMDIRYCVICERLVLVSAGTLGAVHMRTYNNPGEPFDVDWCDGPFAEVPEPDPMSEEEWDSVFESAPRPLDAEAEEVECVPSMELA